VWTGLKWMIYMAMVFAWISGFVYNMSTVFDASVVINGVCYQYAVWKNPESKLAFGFYYVFSTYVIVLLISVVCYGKILMAIRRQARVMASYNPAGSNTAETIQSNKFQSSAIKTMILVCAFYAVAWTPEKIPVLLLDLDVINMSVPILVGYYLGMFLGFLYICANPFIYATKFDPVRRILKDLILCKVSEPVGTGIQII